MTLWLQEPEGSIPYSKEGQSNNLYPELNQPSFPIDTYFFKIHSNIVLLSTLGLPKGLFPAHISVKILEALIPSSILAT